MNRTLVSALAVPAIEGVRAYIRYFPGRLGKRTATRLFQHRLGWRPYSTLARTRWGATLEVRLPDLIQTTIFLFGVWEPPLTRHIMTSLARGDTFVDVGANVGYYTLLAGSIVGAEGRVFAIEPSPSIGAILRRNVARNRLANVTVLQAAASDHAGTLTLFRGPDINSGVTTAVAATAAHARMEVEATVPCAPLPELVPVAALLAARIVKIDVEGAEASVIRGIVDLLPRFAEHTEFVCELNPSVDAGAAFNVGTIYQCFRQAGYDAFVIPNRYDFEFYLGGHTSPRLARLSSAPRSIVDVVFSRRALDAAPTAEKRSS